MSLVSSSIANLVNGVSQQPYTLRLASQCELQENALSTVSQGLKKRPPLAHIKRIINTPLSDCHVHTINRDAVEQYTVVLTNLGIRVFDMAGVEKVVNAPDGLSYLATFNARQSFKCLTVADYTFILNKDVEVSESVSVIPTRPFEALVAVKTGLYSKQYNININGAGVASFNTPDGTAGAHGVIISTDNIATELYNDLVASAIPGMTVTRYGSVIYLANATDFTIQTYDGYSNAAMVALKGKAQRFSDLPANAGKQDFTIQITGDKTQEFDDYYVKYDLSGNSTGVWRETVKPGIKAGVETTTMPYGLIREADGTFTFRKLVWTERVCGDDESAPQPSFVGNTITDIFFYRNRLAFLSGESVIFSEAGTFFNFYPTTVTSLLDGDRIDISVSHTKVANLLFAVPFSKQLLLFSGETQFSVESGDLLTAKTINVKPTTEFQCSPQASPVGVGRNVYFAVPKGDFEGFREYYLDDNTSTNDAVDVTSHIPKYIAEGVFKTTAALNEDTLVVLSSGDPSAMYVYKFYWNNNEKLQSSWSRWPLSSSDTILNAEFIQSKLYLTISRDDGVYQEVLDVSLGVASGNEPYEVMLDRKRTIPASFLTYAAPYTTINPAQVPWPLDDGAYVVVSSIYGSKPAGVLKDVLWDGTTAKFRGDLTGSDLIIGRRYAFRYRFSPLLPRVKSPTGEKADTVAKLQVRNLRVQYSETGYFEAQVTPLGRDTYTYTFSGKVLGLDSATIGSVNLATGTFQFPVMAKNTEVVVELVNDSPLPSSFLSADWEGFHVKRSQGM